MHSLVFVDREGYRVGVEKVVSNTSNDYKKVCYISFNDPHRIVIETLKNVKVDTDKFIIVDASRDVKEMEVVSKTIFVMSTSDLFNVYLFMRNIIKEEKINAILIDSISALIYKHDNLPLKEMVSNLLLEVGQYNCDCFVLAFKEHTNHEVLKYIDPMISKSVFL